MKAITKRRFLMAFTMLVSLISVVLAAQEISKATVKPRSKIGAPDLVVMEIGTAANCLLQTTIANIGTAGVPDSAYLMPGGVEVRATKWSGHALGSPVVSVNLADVDPQGTLKSPNTRIKYLWKNMMPDKAGSTIKVFVDPRNTLLELNEANNERAQNIDCTGRPTITIYDVDPPKKYYDCWYRGDQNTYGVLWKTVNYPYLNVKAITLTCVENWDQEPFVPCSEVITVGTNMPNTGKFFFKIPASTVHTGRYEVRVHGQGGVVSNVFMYCIY